MIETIRYSRETAVEEGLRTSTEIDKSYFKRPAFRMLKKNTVRYGHGNYTNYEHQTAMEKVLQLPSKLVHGRTHVTSYIKDDKQKAKLVESLLNKKNFISINDLKELESFKKKTINVYVEKQHNNIYTLRDFATALVYVAEVNLREFYDIAGKVVLINLSKEKGAYKVHYVLNVIEDGKK